MSETVKKKRKKKKNSYADVLAGIFPCKGDSAVDVLRKMIFLIAITVFAVCAFLISDYFYENYKSREFYENISSGYIAVERIQPESPSFSVDYDYDYDDEDISLLPGAEYLLGLNPDTIGYISIPGTAVNYPIVHKTTQEEKEYYLYRNFSGEDAKAGAIFLDWRLSFGAREQSPNLIIYGHDMKDGSMFGELRNYKRQADFYSKHPIIELNSNYYTYKYKIFGFFIADADSSNSDNFDYWNAVNLSSEEAFYDYVNGVKKRTLRLTNVDVKYGDHIISLSTCGQEFSTSRFVVVARRVRDGESLLEGTYDSVENPNPLMPNVMGKKYDANAEFIPYG